jgi:L-seryl-tRNA(Ser) seleniumtransferase
MREEIRRLLRELPRMDELLDRDWVPLFEARLGRRAVRSVFSEVIGELRDALRHGEAAEVDLDSLLREARGRLTRHSRRSLRRVINATGVVVHTNLGRSPLAEEAVAAAEEAARAYSTLEFDLERGARGSRNDHVEWLLREMVGADGALVVNNNAAAVLLCLSSLARGKEVLVSRGELVEIGGSFRIPDVLAYSGARMVEVGTTNRTRVSDYAEAISGETAVLLKVHPSNFKISGFTETPAREELAALARERELVFLEDLGSGLLVDPAVPELTGEPTVRACLEAGVDLVTFSGDKLLGGPQIGGIAGRKQLVDPLRRDPLLRALRVDKMTLAAFEATLRLYLSGREEEIPALVSIRIRPEELRRRARILSARIRRALPELEVQARSCDDAVGGGAFPTEALPGWALAVRLAGLSAGGLAERLRRAPVPLLVGAESDRAMIHLRTLLPGDETDLVEALRFAVTPGSSQEGDLGIR